MAPRSGPGSCVSDVHLHVFHFGHKSLIMGSSASASHGPFVTAAYTPLRCVWAFCNQKDFPCSSGCRNTQNACNTTNPFVFWSKQTSEWQVTHPLLKNIKWSTTDELIHVLCYRQKDTSQTSSLCRLYFLVSSDECDANRCSDRIESMFDVGTFCHFSLTKGWSQTSASTDCRCTVKPCLPFIVLQCSKMYV